MHRFINTNTAASQKSVQARMSKNAFDGGDSEVESHSVHNYALDNRGYGSALYWLP